MKLYNVLSKKNYIDIKVILSSIVLSVFFICSGCRSYPYIENIVSSVPKDKTSVEVKTAIREAASSKGWILQETDDSSFIAILPKENEIQVTIIISPRKYSINYLSSKGYKKEGNRIHPRYNKYVNNLNREIQYYLTKN